MHDALIDVTERMDANAEFFGVLAQRVDLRAAGQIGDWLVDVPGWGVVVFGGDGEVWAANLAAGHAQTVECLWTGYLVNQVQVDVEQVWRTIFALGDQVVIPDFFSQCKWLIAHADTSTSRI